MACLCCGACTNGITALNPDVWLTDRVHPIEVMGYVPISTFPEAFWGDHEVA